MTTTAARLLHCQCGAATVEVERRPDGRYDALVLSKNHGIMRVDFARVEGVCRNCGRRILLAQELTVDAIGVLPTVVS